MNYEDRMLHVIGRRIRFFNKIERIFTGCIIVNLLFVGSGADGLSLLQMIIYCSPAIFFLVGKIFCKVQIELCRNYIAEEKFQKTRKKIKRNMQWRKFLAA